MSDRQEKVSILLKETVARFLQKENNNSSLITVTKAKISPDFKKSTIYITVFPENKEKGALDFAKRKRKEIRDYIKKNVIMKNIPFIDIEIDKGEKNRQKIDELLRNK